MKASASFNEDFPIKIGITEKKKNMAPPLIYSIHSKDGKHPSKNRISSIAFTQQRKIIITQRDKETKNKFIFKFIIIEKK